MSLFAATISTPVGPFTTIVNGADTVLASGWTAEPAELAALIHPTLRADVAVRADLGAITAAATAYHDGDLTAIDAIAVLQRSGPFIERSWSALRAVPAGAPVTYRELATQAGNEAAFRASASACARNAAALFVPCHRVVRTGSGLGGFRYGLTIKRWLLDHEDPEIALLARA